MGSRSRRRDGPCENDAMVMRALVLVGLLAVTAEARRIPVPDEVAQKAIKRVTDAMESVSKQVMQCSRKHESFVDALSVAVLIAHRRIDVRVPPRGSEAFQTCVHRTVALAVRGMYFQKPHDQVTARFLYKVEMRAIE
jgi:hypothetical protein